MRRDVRYLESFDRVVERHRKVFEAAVVRSLYERERALQAVSGEYQTLMTRHDATKEEIDALTVRSEQLRDELPPHARHSIDFSDLRRVSPVAQDWGYERGVPVDRFYIEGFLEQHASDVRGAVIEVQEADYTKRFGGESVTRSDVLDLDVENTRATVVSDLRAAANIADGVYDCVILTQTAHVIDDIRAVVSEVARILKPGGVVLATLPCASRVCLEYGHDGDFWWVTEDGAREVFSRSFPADGLDVKAKGNVLANAAFLYGLACHELTADELTTNDPYNPLLVTVRAQKSKPRVMESAPRTSRQPERAGERGGTHGAAVLLYHRVATVDSDIHGLCVHPAVFRAQMQCLCDRYHPMPLVELIEACQADAAPEGAVSLTFDDGYLDNYSTASPILTELGIPAVFFVTTDKLDEPDPYEFWWDVVEESLLSETHERPVTLSLTLPGGARVFPTRTHADRLETHWAVYDVLSGLPPDPRDEAVACLARWSGRRVAAPLGSHRMTSEELRVLAGKPGQTIGAHSVRHLMLPKFISEVQRGEVAGSKTALEAVLGHPVRLFAYPFGGLDDGTVAAVVAAGFGAALTCEERPLHPGVDVMRLPRLAAPTHDADDFGDWLAECLSRN